MLFINGIGYVDNQPVTNINSKQVNNTDSTSFDKVLNEETNRINTQNKTLDDIFKEASETYNVPYDLLKAVAYTESGFQANATSPAGAMGIMQLMPSTAKSLGVTDPYDAYQNIMGGAKLLSQLSNVYDGNVSLMLAAYNAGPGNVAKYNGIPPFKETQNYVAKITGLLGTNIDAAALYNQVTSNSSYVQNGLLSGLSSTTPTDYRAQYNEWLRTTNFDSVFSYTEYELFMTYFDAMMSMFSSSIYEDEKTQENQNDSLVDLFRLGNL